MSYKGVECQSLEEELPLKMDINYKGNDFETGMDMYLFVLKNYDLLARSIEYAEKFLLSYEFNICEDCLSNYDYLDCCFCANDFKDIYPFTEEIKKKLSLGTN